MKLAAIASAGWTLSAVAALVFMYSDVGRAAALGHQ